jgi:hypothetical protein
LRHPIDSRLEIVFADRRRQTALPLLMYVLTSRRPPAQFAFSDAIETMFLPPTLIPRRNAT